MFDKEKKYWLVIAPYVYCCIKNKQALLYNTKNGKSLEIENKAIIALLQQLHKKQNLGTVYCKGNRLVKPEYKDFLCSFLAKEMGYIQDIMDFPERPIQMMPILNIQCDVDKLQKTEERDVGEMVLLYLSELNIYLYNVCHHHCGNCNKIAKQKLCCYLKENELCQAIDVTALKHIFSQIKYAPIGKLNLFGGNIFQYPHYEALLPLLTQFKGKIHIWSHYLDFVNNVNLNPNFIYNIIVPFPLEKEQLLLSSSLLNSLQMKIHFYVTQYDECTKAEEIIDKYKIDDFSIHPVYIDTNSDFFKEYVYMSKDDILQFNTSFNQIFIHQNMNSHFFGSLTISVNGDVSANLNSPVLGNIYKDALVDIVNREMIENTAWRKIRDSQPCSDCLFQYLCPSPSNYEVVIGKSNLCHVK